MRAEAHALEAVLFHPVAQTLGNVRIFRIDQPVRDEELRILVKAVADIGVVPAEVIAD